MNYYKYSRHVIIAILSLTVLGFIPLSGLKFDFNTENFFPVNDPDLEYFTEFQGRFYTQIDDEYIFIALTSDHGIFNREFLEKIDSLTRFITKLDNILSVYSLANIPSISFEEGNLVSAPLIHIDQPDLYRSDSVNVFQSNEYRELMLSKDGRTTTITALNKPELNDVEKDKILNNIQQQINQLDFDDSHVAAKIKLEQTYIKEIEKNLIRYLSISFLLIAIVLSLMYRSVIGVLVPLITIVIAICWTLAMIAVLDFPLDIISVLLPPVLAVICMSDIVHVTTKYIDESRKGIPKKTALTNTFREIGMATFFTSITTAAGFYALCVTNVLPIKTFGFFAGTGVLIAFIISMAMIFAVYANTPVPKITQRKYLGDQWQHSLSKVLGFLVAKKYFVSGIFLILLIPSALLINRIQVNSSLLQELPQNNPILEDYKFIESQFAGTRSFEMALILNDTTNSFLNLETLRDIERISQYLEDSIGVGNLFSPVTFIKGANRSLSGGDAHDYQLPSYQQDVYVCFDKIILSPLGKDMVRYMTQDGRHARIGGKLPNLTIKEFASLSERFESYFNTSADSFDFTYKMTGSALLIDKVSFSLIRNLFTGLAIGFCVISLIIMFMFRSVKMVLIVLLANIIPIVFMAAIMGGLGIFLKADTAIIFAIAFGIVVDDSIHFVNRFKLERSKGKSVYDAVRQTYVTTGKAMVITTIILLAGFVSLTFSTFGGAYYIGLLVSICLVIALVVDLTLLPILILIFIKDK